MTYQDVGLDELEMLCLDGGRDDDGCLGYSSAKRTMGRPTIPVELQARGLFLVLWPSPFLRSDPHRDGQSHKHQGKGEDGGMIDIAMFVDCFERLPKQLLVDWVPDKIDFGKKPVD